MRVQIVALLFALCSHTAYGFTDARGHAVNMADWRQKWVIINYWASWCDACAKEIPQLNLFYQRHQDTVVLVGVNYDNLSADNLLSVVNALHIRFPVLRTNPAKALGFPDLGVLPTTFVINPEGKIVKQLFGPQTAVGLEDIINGRS